MYGFRPVVRLITSLCLLHITIPAANPGQSAASAPETTPLKAAPAQEDKPSLSVMIRLSNGTPVNTMAVITLYDSSGQAITSKTTSDASAVFDGLANGAYIVDVDAPGYAKSRLDAKITPGEGDQLAIVTLNPDTGSSLNTVSTNVVLPAKPQKELNKGLESLRGGKFDEAIKHLEAAQHMAPKEAEIPYLLGMAHEKKGDLAQSHKDWDQALQLNPKHLAALIACGDSLMRQKDVKGAREYLDKAVEADPNSWRAQGLLAAALLQQKSYVEAVTHAQRAIEMGKAEANSARLTLGEALAYQNKNQEAITALQAYIAGGPSQSLANAAQNMVVRLQSAAAADAAAPVVDYSTAANGAAAKEAADAPLSAAELRWLPPDIDVTVPPVEPGVSCPLDETLKNASARVKELPLVVDRYAATEVLHHEDVNTAGYADREEDLSFNYVASVREIENKYGQSLDVQEYRNGSTGTEMFPKQMASVGLPSIVLIFHPILMSDFEMKCEGLSRAHGNFAWQVYFRQRADKESRIRRYRVGGHVFAIALKGRAWIDANNFQVVRLETDIREPHPELRLNAEHLVMEYGPVKFKRGNEELWLPSSADYYAVLRGQRFHRRHSFTNYVLFSVENKEKIGEPPKEKTSTTVPDEKKSSN